MNCVFATSVFARLLGLLRTSVCADGEVLVLTPCKSIHTFGMRCAIDIAFLDATARVLVSERNVVPGKMRSCAQAALVLERRSNPGCSWPLAGERMYIGIGAPAPFEKGTR